MGEGQNKVGVRREGKGKRKGLRRGRGGGDEVREARRERRSEWGRRHF